MSQKRMPSKSPFSGHQCQCNFCAKWQNRPQTHAHWYVYAIGWCIVHRKQQFKKTARNCSRYLVDWKSKWLAKGLEKSLNQAAMEVKSGKREGKRLYARAQKWSCQTCLFLDSREPTFELTRNCFSLPGESKNGHACRKNGCPPRVHFQATNVNAISAPSGRIGRRPTRIDTSMQSVDASCTASNNSRKLPATVQGTLLIEKANDWLKVWRRVWIKLQWKLSREKGRASVCMRVPKSGLARRAYFWILGSPLLSSRVIVFPYQAGPKMGTHVAKTDALQESIFRPPMSMQFLRQVAE